MIQLCLKCARQEGRSSLSTCPICGGTLWFPQNVGGDPAKNGKEHLKEAADLIKAGKIPWNKP